MSIRFSIWPIEEEFYGTMHCSAKEPEVVEPGFCHLTDQTLLETVIEDLAKWEKDPGQINASDWQRVAVHLREAADHIDSIVGPPLPRYANEFQSTEG